MILLATIAGAYLSALLTVLLPAWLLRLFRATRDPSFATMVPAVVLCVVQLAVLPLHPWFVWPLAYGLAWKTLEALFRWRDARRAR